MEKDKLLEWCKGNESAVEMLEIIGQAFHKADDLADEDLKFLEKSKLVSDVLYDLLVKLPYNKFYAENIDWLAPVFSMIFTTWHVSNIWQKGQSVTDLIFAFVLRHLYDMLIPVVAERIGGKEWADYVLIELQNYYHQDEKFEDWASSIVG